MKRDDDDETALDRLRRRTDRNGSSFQTDWSDDERRRILADRADRYRNEKNRAVRDVVELVVFRRRNHRYAVELGELEEIRRAGDIRPVPGVSSVIAGVVNVRGQIVAIHDLAAFRGDPAALDEQTWVLVGRCDDVLVGLPADDVEGVRTPSRDDIQSVPLSMDGPHGEFRGVVDETVLVLDFDGLTDNDEFFAA